MGDYRAWYGAEDRSFANTPNMQWSWHNYAIPPYIRDGWGRLTQGSHILQTFRYQKRENVNNVYDIFVISYLTNITNTRISIYSDINECLTNNGNCKTVSTDSSIR